MSDTMTKIMDALEVLPEARRAENGERDPTENPLLDFIGGAEHGSLAQDIDEELYGRDGGVRSPRRADG
jgi:hypothetical protein